MITEKAKISKNFPVIVKFYLKWNLKLMYLFPQGYTCSGTIQKMRYDDEKSRKGETVYETKAYWLYEQYYFRWLFLCVIFTVRLKPECTTNVILKDYRPDMDVEKLKCVHEPQSN